MQGREHDASTLPLRLSRGQMAERQRSALEHKPKSQSRSSPTMCRSCLQSGKDSTGLSIVCLQQQRAGGCVGQQCPAHVKCAMFRVQCRDHRFRRQTRTDQHTVAVALLPGVGCAALACSLRSTQSQNTVVGTRSSSDMRRSPSFLVELM